MSKVFSKKLQRVVSHTNEIGVYMHRQVQSIYLLFVVYWSVTLAKKWVRRAIAIKLIPPAKSATLSNFKPTAIAKKRICMKISRTTHNAKLYASMDRISSKSMLIFWSCAQVSLKRGGKNYITKKIDILLNTTRFTNKFYQTIFDVQR